MKTINIKGKDYIEVNERLKYFREHYKNYSLMTEIIELTENRVVMRAIIKDENHWEIADGIAYETINSSYINKTSFIENCQTSAWGRALGNLGIGIDTSVASFEEVQNAINNQSDKLTKHDIQTYINLMKPFVEDKEQFEKWCQYALENPTQQDKKNLENMLNNMKKREKKTKKPELQIEANDNKEPSFDHDFQGQDNDELPRGVI
jgi:hypothetical protein